jgi:hypothetical protein
MEPAIPEVHSATILRSPGVSFSVRAKKMGISPTGLRMANRVVNSEIAVLEMIMAVWPSEKVILMAGSLGHELL